MTESKFWADFHAAWGRDSSGGEANKPVPGYNKEAWKYVQGKMEEYFKEQESGNRRKDREM